MKPAIQWPDGKRFAFTVFDDTDHTTLQNGPQLYSFLAGLGVFTTKSVWPLKGKEVPRIGGATCEDPGYLRWVIELQNQGFEIAMHNATYHSSKREDALAGMEKFKEYFGAYPNIQVNHAECKDCLYWGEDRLSGIYRLAYNALTRFRNKGAFQGSQINSDYFWGDVLKQHVSYVRNFVYHDINTLKKCPEMPYHDPRRPLVNSWFASSEGADCTAFCKTISEENQDRLEEEGGACIMYTHFGTPGFYSKNGQLNPEFVHLMTRLSQKNGWFVPVSTLLDYIRKVKGEHQLTSCQRNRLERNWLYEKIFITGGTS